jgi:hypothetical protein
MPGVADTNAEHRRLGGRDQLLREDHHPVECSGRPGQVGTAQLATAVQRLQDPSSSHEPAGNRLRAIDAVVCGRAYGGCVG